MTPFLEFLRASAPVALEKFVWPMLWQSSLLIGGLFLLDRLLRRRLRPAIRYSIWLVVLVKLLLPPSLALPTSLAWWLRPAAAPTNAATHRSVIVTYGPPTASGVTTPAAAVSLPPAAPRLPLPAWALLVSTAVSAGLIGIMLVRWRQIARMANEASVAPPALTELLEKASRRAGVIRRIRLRVIDRQLSPALCGFFRPVILLPRALAETFPARQLEAVLVHELIHLRRHDVWLNALQAIVQAAYWWHPLVWLANGRIRRLREQAVDDAVMLALRDEAATYAPTLLEVARLALARPLSSLGLVGIFESRTALRERILRLEEFRAPKTPGLTQVSLAAIFGFASVALPMGQAPARVTQAQPSAASDPTNFTQVARLDSDADNSVILVQQAKVLFELGKLNDAETMLREAVQRNPRNEAAYYYLNVIAESRDKARKSKDEGAARLQHPFLLQTNPFSGTLNRRQVIYRKLDAIRFGSVSYDHLPLHAVVDKLNAQFRSLDLRSLDPENRGVDFALNPDNRSGSTRGDSGPATGAPVAANPTDGADDIGQIPITILPALTDVRVLDVLDAVVKAASRPIKYSIEDSGVVFSEKRANEPAPLYVRIIKVDPDRLFNGLALVADAGSPQRDPRDLNRTLRDFFAKQGVTLEAPKAVFFNDRDDTLVVRATLQDLDTIETAISALNDVFTPNVLIKARFIAVPRIAAALLWLDLGLKNPSQQSVTRILTPAQTEDLLRTITSDTNVDLLSESRIETRPGRQTEMQVVDVKTVVMGIDPGALSPPGIPGTSVPYLTTNMTFGPILDIVPYLATNRLEIEITATALLQEFLGYDKPDQEVPIYVGGKTVKGVLPLPHIRIRRMATPERLPVRSGWSVLLGNPMSQNGRPAEEDETISKSLFVLITPALVDPAGNPVTK